MRVFGGRRAAKTAVGIICCQKRHQGLAGKTSLLLKPVVTSNLLPFRRFCALNNFINTIIDYMVWIFIFLQSLVLYQLIVKDNKVLKEE